MVRGSLVRALDWPKKPGDESGQYSYRAGNVWHVVKYGPGFLNNFRVTHYDDAGLEWLQQHDEKGERRAEDRALRP